MTQYDPTALPEGAVFHCRYQIARRIKAGGMGAVYECIHLATRKRRALKVMLPQVVRRAEMRDRFELEAKVTADIESDHIVETFDAGVDEATGSPFLVMELLRGDDLDSILKKRGPFTAETTVALLSQIAPALDKTHAAGIVHRDLKPQNLYLTTRDDGSPRLKILDFGIAKVIADGSETVEETAALGTPLYMAPEQATGDGHIGAPADLYALAHIAYTLLAGRAYWTDEREALPMYPFLARVIEGAPEPPSVRAGRCGVALPAAFDAWFLRATRRAPDQRFPRASTQIAELATALGTPAPQPPGQEPSRLGAPTPRPPSQPPGPGSSSISGTSRTSVGSMGALLEAPVSAPRARRWAVPVMASAVLLVFACIAATATIARMGRVSPAPTTAAPPASTVEARAAAPAAPERAVVVAVEPTEPGTAAPSVSAPPRATATPNAKPAGAARPIATAKLAAIAKPEAAAPPTDPTRIR